MTSLVLITSIVVVTCVLTLFSSIDARLWCALGHHYGTSGEIWWSFHQGLISFCCLRADLTSDAIITGDAGGGMLFD